MTNVSFHCHQFPKKVFFLFHIQNLYENKYKFSLLNNNISVKSLLKISSIIKPTLILESELNNCYIIGKNKSLENLSLNSLKFSSLNNVRFGCH